MAGRPRASCQHSMASCPGPIASTSRSCTSCLKQGRGLHSYQRCPSCHLHWCRCQQQARCRSRRWSRCPPRPGLSHLALSLISSSSIPKPHVPPRPGSVASKVDFNHHPHHHCYVTHDSRKSRSLFPYRAHERTILIYRLDDLYGVSTLFSANCIGAAWLGKPSTLAQWGMKVHRWKGEGWRSRVYYLIV